MAAFPFDRYSFLRHMQGFFWDGKRGPSRRWRISAKQRVMERARIVVQGRVQGVYYRASARDQARRLNLSGWVRNCPDGNVELVAEGERMQLEQLVAWCHTGPPAAVVTQVGVEWQNATGEFAGFAVKY